MIKYSSLLIVFLALATAGCAAPTPTQEEEFGIYLLQEDMATSQFQATDLSELALRERPFLTSNDILTYDKSTHVFELTAAAYQQFQARFPTPVDVDGIPFVVTVGAERIYGGALWTPLSSLSFDGVIIMQPFATDNHLVGLSLGYPSSAVFTGADPRADARIMEALKAAGKLR